MRNNNIGQAFKHISFIIIFAFLFVGCTSAPYDRAWVDSYSKDKYAQQQKPTINWSTQKKRKSLQIYYDTAQEDINKQQYNFANQQGNNHSSYDNNVSVIEYDYIEDAPQNKIANKEIIVALLLPMSGKYSHIGKSMMNAAQMALFDLDGSAFKLIPKDTKGTEAGARQAAIEAVQAGADLILGPVFSKNAHVVKLATKYSNIPIITYTTDWTVAGGNAYVMGFLPFSQVIRVVNYASDNGYGRIGFLGPSNNYSDIVLRTLRYSLKKQNKYLVKDRHFSAGQPDLHVIVQDFIGVEIPDETEPADGIKPKVNIKDDVVLPFDAVMLPVGGQTLKSLTNMFTYYNVDAKRVKFLGTGLWDDESLTHEVSLYGGWFAAPDPNLRADFNQRYQENFGEKPERLASLAYDSAALAIVLAKTYGGVGEPYSKERLVTQQGYAGIDGIFRFRPDNLVERGLAVLEITPRGIKVIDPAPDAFFIVNN